MKPEVFRDILGLVLHENEVKILPQKNSYFPQMYIYKLHDFSPENIKGIHTILEFQNRYIEVPNVIYKPITNKIDIVGGIKRDITPVNNATRIGLNLNLESNFFIYRR